MPLVGTVSREVALDPVKIQPGFVTQGTSATTAVTLNTTCGVITTYDVIATGVDVEFTVNNDKVTENSIILVTVVSEQDNADGIPVGINIHTVANGSFKVAMSNESAGSTAAAPKVNFLVINGL